MWPGADPLAILLIALAGDALFGDPDALWRRWPHPIVWIGTMIGRLDAGLNHEADPDGLRRAKGVAALVLLLAICGALAALVDSALRALPGHPWTVGFVASVFIAQNSLYRHVARVRAGFLSDGLAGARRAVSLIVGRDPEVLDEAGITRAAIESTAENFSDGVVAPAFWCALLGLPGLVLYKAINTADSMIGHLSARHAAFGWAAARLDDLVNLVPARLAGLLIALAAPLAGGSVRTAFVTMLRDARLHRSPNAGWPEAAMAGALGLALAGTRRYGARVVEDPFLNPKGRMDSGPRDITRALRVYGGACALLFSFVAALWSLAA